MVLRSDALRIFLELCEHPTASWRMVNLAGRGIAAEADFALWILEGDKNESSGREYFAHAGDSVVHEDFLSEAWEAFRSGAMAPDRFEHDLTFIVSEMEKSIWSRSQVAADD